ncbi:hypothetical protein Tco_1151777 [Tanacetum coccineum]
MHHSMRRLLLLHSRLISSQPGGIANPHHMGPTMGGNVEVTPGAPRHQMDSSSGVIQNEKLNLNSFTFESSDDLLKS